MSMMIDKFVSLDLMEFIERNILPRYNQFDKAHGLIHVTRVIKSSLELAQKTGADIDMVYAIAAYHDLGLEGPRAIHHLTSGKILMADVRLRKWFSPEKLRIMKEAVEDHRASASHDPRSIATWNRRWYSAGQSNMASTTTQKKRRRNNGNAS